MKNIIIFGANGYIGRHIIRYHINKGDNIIGYDIHSESIIDGSDSFNYNQTNILDIEKISNIDFNCDVFYYFSGVTGTNVSNDDYSKFIDINEKGLLNVLERIKLLDIKPLVIVPSTRLVYKGQKDTPIKENDEKEFRTIYSINKYHNENSIKLYNNLYNIDYLIFRICVPYGNDIGNGYSYGTIGFFINSAINQKSITLFGKGDYKRTFTHVNDICKQINGVINSEARNEIFNIGGETFSLNEVAEKIGTKFESEVKYKDYPKELLILESGDTIFDSTKIGKIYNLTDSYKIDDWLNNLI